MAVGANVVRVGRRMRRSRATTHSLVWTWARCYRSILWRRPSRCGRSPIRRDEQQSVRPGEALSSGRSSDWRRIICFANQG